MNVNVTPQKTPYPTTDARFIELVNLIETFALNHERELAADEILGQMTKTPDEPLTGREEEIAHCLAMGLSEKEIAEKLMIVESTVKKHCQNIKHKWHAPSQCTAVLHVMALSRGYGQSTSE